ncbi:MAG: glycosyltransferase family 2 protein [Betaproteobacteria bacterium]|nr:glycosyltransferase family 2 protein [Betaproteobacteria bacterium]
MNFAHPKAAVAVIVVNYNSGELLRRCLAALTRQTYPSFRVIVVDNASSDDSLKGVGESFPDTQILRQSANLGFAAGNNAGIAAVGDCKWIACLNPDAFPEPDWLASLMAAAARYPDCASFGSRLIMAEDPARLDGTGDVYHVSGLAWRRGHGRSVERGIGEGDEIFAPCAAAALYRRDALADVGGFDASYFCYFEDVDLGFRLRLRGYRSRYVPESRALHVGSAITGFRSDFSIYHGHRNMVWAYFKNMPTPLLWLYLPQHLLANVLTILLYAGRGRGGAILKAKWHALKAMPEIWRARREVQSRRKVGAREIRRQLCRKPLAPYWKRV